ncbi:MAG: MbnP family protein [Lentimicrobiaceae bacterium]
MKYSLLAIPLFGFLMLTNVSCNNDKPDPIQPTGHISFNFTHLVDGLPLEKDNMKYVNAAGNPYEINQVMYFISDVTLHKSGGTKKLISDWTDIHYVDIDMPETLKWDVYDDIQTGAYDSVSFVFGITEEKNKSFMFVNPPEVNMMWPDFLGGGYHYMMINGSWKDESNVIKSFAFHLGIGQLYKSNVINVDSIYAFVQNYFSVKLPNSSFTIEENKTRQIEIIMNIDSWFKTPHIYDHNYWGGAIMQNQQAMQMAKENGYDVFAVGSIQ